MEQRVNHVKKIDGKVPNAPAPITTNKALRDMICRFSEAEFVAVDTEFLREHTYYPQLCLIQISDGVKAVTIDPFSENLDLTPVWDLMLDTNITKVFHG